MAVASPPCDSLSVAGDEYLIPFGSPVSCSGQILNFELHNFLPINLEFLSFTIMIAMPRAVGTHLVGLLTGRKPEDRTA